MGSEERRPASEDADGARRTGAGFALARGDRVAGRYRVVEALDRKRLVWRAVDRNGGSVVLKTGPRAHVEAEFRVLDGLEHPHIVAVDGLVEFGEQALIVLEDLPGGDLVSLAGSPAARWLPAVAGVIDALGYLHARGLVHRDLKARNVRFDAAERVRLIDFGSAALAGSPFTRHGTTSEGVAPARGAGPVDPADDVYALAALLYEMRHGVPPCGTSRAAGGSDLAMLVARTLDEARTNRAPTLADFEAGVKSMRQQDTNRGLRN